MLLLKYCSRSTSVTVDYPSDKYMFKVIKKSTNNAYAQDVVQNAFNKVVLVSLSLTLNIFRATPSKSV